MLTFNRTARMRPRTQSFMALAALLTVAGVALAAVPETVIVGHAGNAADSTGFGAVPYDYRIGKYEVTNAQYCEFLNAVAKVDNHGLYQGDMAGEYGGITQTGASGNYVYAVKGGMANKPVNYVSWFDALRYANWLSNGQGKGDTESGPYTVGPEGAMMPDHATLAAGKSVKWVLASENEWYKAAYYDHAKGGGAGYWPYASKGGIPPDCNINTNEPKDVGSFANSPSPNGTFDQNGNMWEWNETQHRGKCGVRGGSFYLNDTTTYLLSTTRYVTNPPGFRFANYGFRVVALGTGDPKEQGAKAKDKSASPTDASAASKQKSNDTKAKVKNTPDDE